MLLAKSPTPNRPDYPLADHLTDTETAALALFQKRIGRNWCRFWQVDPDQFLLHLRIAALAHDLGKANNGFQQTVRGRGEQSHRHEHISAVLLTAGLHHLMDCPAGIDWPVVLAAVVGHHCKVIDEGGHRCQFLPLGRIGQRLDPLQIDSTLDEVWARICTLAGVSAAPCPRPTPEAIAQCRAVIVEHLAPSLDCRRTSSDRRRLLAAVRTALICADAVASASFRTGRTMQGWLADSIHRPALAPADIQGLLDARYPDAAPYGWQADIANGPDRQAVIVGCGGGKTYAGYRWARERMARHSLGRVLFLYPTQGTALEGFRDYAAAAGPAEALLLSGTARLDLEAIASNPDEDYNTDEALFALGAWDRRIFTGTVDQFLGAWEYQYGPICHLPLLADAALILDEVHAYDERMWARVKSLLAHTQGPVLLLSATLQPHRIRDLEALGITVHQGGGSTAQPTYRFRFVSEEEAMAAASAHRDGRVLMVANTVSRCQVWGQRVGADVIYHSRFRRCDRRVQHERTMVTLRKSGVVVATQVCEMSLDVSASLMVTDLASLPAVIQRAGRVNRYGEYEVAEILIVTPPDPLPYSREDLDEARRLLATVTDRVVDQGDLAGLMAELQQRRSLDQEGQLMESGMWALAADWRDTDDRTVLVVLERDLEQALALCADPRQRHRLDDLLCPAPRRWAMAQGRSVAGLPAWVRVVPCDGYNPARGLTVGETYGRILTADPVVA